jgi:pimeloyl-ACP methyl ester carboxylesterase
MMFRVWFYDPQLASQQLHPFLDSIDPYGMAAVEQHVLGSLGEFSHWSNFEAITNPVLIVYGYQDFEPITQAYTLREWMPQTQIAMLNRCGHWPWLEQPEQFYKVVEAFLQA